LSQIASAVEQVHAQPGIELDRSVTYCPISIDVAMPAGLLVNELLTNAFKHAFAGKERGRITLECRHDGGIQTRIVVSDDGVGLPAGVTLPDQEKLSGIILQTLRENTENLDFDIRSSPGRGTQIIIVLVHPPPTGVLATAT
jgi:two-component sensor histidine kinase